MKLKHCTLSGFTAVDHYDLVALAKANQHAEFGFLFSLDRCGQKRYCTPDYIGNMANAFKVQRSLHLCGKVARDIPQKMVDKKEREGLLYICRSYDRIQLNINFTSREHPVNETEFGEFLEAVNPTPVIIQYNKNNEHAWETYFKDFPNTQLLFDASGGKGKKGEWTPPIYKDKLHGYAGGITADTIEQDLQDIEVVVGKHEVWVDMETGIRDKNNDLDPRKAAHVMEATKRYLK